MSSSKWICSSKERDEIRIFVFEGESNVVVDVFQGHLHKSISHDFFPCLLFLQNNYTTKTEKNQLFI